MKIVITLFLSVFLFATFISCSFPFHSVQKSFILNPHFPCYNISHWKELVEKVKNEHPSVSDQELVIFITQEIMKDSSKPLFALSEIGGKNKNDEIPFYGDFMGTAKECKNFWKSNISVCEMENNLSLTIIYRKNKVNENDENVALLKLYITKTFHGIPEIVECKDIPKVQAIIDKIDAMGLSSADQYNRIFVDEFYAIMKPKHVFSSKSIKWGEEVSVIARGKETEDDLKHCAFNFDEKCRRCVHVKSLKVLFVDYYEH